MSLSFPMGLPSISYNNSPTIEVERVREEREMERNKVYKQGSDNSVVNKPLLKVALDHTAVKCTQR